MSIVQVNVNAGGMNIVGDAANEPSIAVDPVDPSRMSVGWRQFDTIASNHRQAGRAYSRDGGRTWTRGAVLEPGVFRSDPVLRADADGRMYYLSLSLPASVFSCETFRSDDGGVTFGPARNALGGDKEWLCIDTRPGPTRNAMYQHWTQAFSRSFDLGQTWLTAQGGNPIWGQCAVGTDGALLIVGRSSSNFAPILFSRAPDAGGVVQPTLSTQALPAMGGVRFGIAGSPNPSGILGQPLVAVDRSGGPRHGWIYVAGAFGPFGTDPCEVMFTRSADQGQTWSTPIRVNTSTPGSGDWQWFAAMDVAPTGRIDMVFFDTRESQVASISRLLYTSSADGGSTWAPEQVLSPAFNSTVGWPMQSKIGDYSDMHSDELGCNVIFAATFNNEQDVWFARIGARLCPGDFTRDGVVSVQDIFAFLTAFFAEDIRADLSRDFAVGVQDVFVFLERWFSPCVP